MKNNKKDFTLPAISRTKTLRGVTLRGRAHGFTLIELLVVVLIIGILAAVALPQYKKAVVRSRLSTLKNIVETITQAAEVYYMANNTYPSTFDQMDVDIPTPTELNGNTATYSWGWCNLQKSSTDALVGCENIQEGIEYLHRFANISDSKANQRACRGCNPTAIDVCQQETGQSTSYFSNEECAAYAYK